MSSMQSKTWDSPSYDQSRRKYDASRLSIIFNLELESNKGQNYSLGRINVAGQQIEDLPRYKVINQETEGYYYIPLDPDLEIVDGNDDNIVGTILKENDLWKYSSRAEYINQSSATPQNFSYYTISELKSLGPGRVVDDLVISSVASVGYNIISPAEFPSRKEIFRTLSLKAFGDRCKYREACIVSLIDEVITTDEILYAIVSDTKQYNAAWQNHLQSQASIILESNSGATAREIFDLYLDMIDDSRQAILLQIKSKYSRGSIDLSDEYARPVFSRLPLSYQSSEDNLIFLENISDRFKLKGLEVGTVVTNKTATTFYKYRPRRITSQKDKYLLGLDPLDPDQIFSEADTQSWVIPATPPSLPINEWLISGTDSLLDENKQKADQFFHEILDPRTCKESALDWISQFFGFTDLLWDTNWTAEQKRATLLNSFGWYDSSLRDERTSSLSLKGEVLSQAPFSKYPENWIEDTSNEANFYRIVSHELEPHILVETDSLYDLEPVPDSNFSISKEEWPGLHESKGSLINIMWWLSNFDVCRANDIFEISDYQLTYDYEVNLIRRDSDGINLRETSPSAVQIERVNTEMDVSQSNKLTRPIVISQTQTVEPDDVGFASNPLIAGVTPLYDEFRVVIPVSYKYSRLDPVWDNLSYVISNWAPVFCNIAAQYPYAASDFVAAGDVFFEKPAA